MKKIILSAMFALLGTSCWAAPSLRAEVSVNRPIVTIGDMFADAGNLAERGLFRAPEPGKTGIVSLEAIRAAAARAGLTNYSQEGVLSVRVERQATIVDTAALTELIRADLSARGLLQPGVEIEARFDAPDLTLMADNVAVPASLGSLQYRPGASGFAARFQIAGMELPVDVSGQIELMVEAPHLVTSLLAGDIIKPDDLEMKRVPLAFADRSGVVDFADVVGKQLRRASRAGVMLKTADVTEPVIVERNTQVTVLLHVGPMTLTMIGQSLANASTGQAVQVLNPVSRKILTGVAIAEGTVEVATAAGQLKVAGL